MALRYRASVRDLLYKCQTKAEVYTALIQAARDFPDVAPSTARKWHRTAQAVLGRIAAEQVRKSLEL